MSPEAARNTIDGRRQAHRHAAFRPGRDPRVKGCRAPGACRAWRPRPKDFAALAAGADGLKLFPGEALPPAVVKAWRAVFPPEVPLLPVGGVTPERMADYVAAGAAGFGIGSALYRPGAPAAEVSRRRQGFVERVAGGKPKSA